jgi:hypothetical protein
LVSHSFFAGAAFHLVGEIWDYLVKDDEQSRTKINAVVTMIVGMVAIGVGLLILLS